MRLKKSVVKTTDFFFGVARSGILDEALKRFDLDRTIARWL